MCLAFEPPNMNVLQRFDGRIGRRHVLVVALAVLVALAGCSGLGGGEETPTPAGTATPSEPATASESSTPAIEDVDASVTDVLGPTVDAIRSVETYRLSGTLNQTVEAPNREQDVFLSVNTSVDRPNEALAAEQTVDTGVRTLTTNSYIVDGRLYQRSQQFVQQYNSEWIQVNISDAIDDRFNRNDELAGHRVMLENSTVELVGAQTVDGERAYRLELDVDEDALADFYGFNGTSVELQNVTTTVWVSTESNRIVRAAGELRRQVTVQGQEVTTVTAYDERFTYEPVEISLPSAAGSAVDVNRTSGVTAG